MNKNEYINYCAALMTGKNERLDSWIKHFKSHIADVVEFDGYTIAIEKTKIKKRFCFGYGSCGTSYDEALNAAETARNSTNYFMTKNMEGIDHLINAIEGNRYKLYHRVKYWTDRPETEVHEVEYLRYCDDVRPGLFEMTESESAKMVDGLKRERDRHEKACKAYLKRYGMKNVQTWEYWVDA